MNWLKKLGVDGFDATNYTLEDLVKFLPADYLRHVSNVLDAVPENLIRDRLESPPFGDDACRIIKIQNDCRVAYDRQESGLLSLYELDLTSTRAYFRIGVSRPDRDPSGDLQLACSQFDYCMTFLILKQNGIMAATPPQIFGAVSSEYSLWSNHYQKKHPEQVIPHNNFVLSLAKHVAEGTQGVDLKFFHHLKSWAFNGFKQKMPGLVGDFHHLRGLMLGAKTPAFNDILYHLSESKPIAALAYGLDSPALPAP